MRRTLKESPKVLGLDVSTRTIGWALFDMQTKELLELTHISPRPKSKENLDNSKIKEDEKKDKEKKPFVETIAESRK